jgi:hypothetical protein
MFNKNIFLQHTTNTPGHNKITQAGVKAPFSLREQVIPMNTAASVNASIASAYPETVRAQGTAASNFVDRVQYQNEEDKKKKKSEIEQKSGVDALRRVTSSQEYADASEEERSKMLDAALQSRGDDPAAFANQYGGSDSNSYRAAYSLAQDTRRQNIDRDVQSQYSQLSDEEKMLPPEELRRRGLIGTRYTKPTKPRYDPTQSEGRPVDPNNPFGPRISTPEDRPNPSRVEIETQRLFAMQDDLRNLRQGIRDRRNQRQRESDAIMRVANADVDRLGRAVKRDDEGNIIQMNAGEVQDTIFQQGRGDHVGTGVRSDALNKYLQGRYMDRYNNPNSVYNSDGTFKGFRSY